MTTKRDDAGRPPAPRRGSRPTIRDVAALAGVSKSAVSRVFNGQGGISEPTRERIQEAARKLGWSPSASASALRGERTRTIGLVIVQDPDALAADQFFAETVVGLEHELGPREYGLRLHVIGPDPEQETALYERLARERRVDAFILTDSRVGDARPDLLRRLGIPGLLIGRPWREGAVECVHSTGLEQAMAAAADHLVELGHRDIAYLAGPADRVHIGLRRHRLERSLASHGLTLRALVDTELTNEATAEATRRLLDDPSDRPTAIIYANDTMALTGIATAQRMGLRVPEDLSVIGHDDLPLGRWFHPRLTTISQDARAISRTAARRLLTLLGEPVEPLPDPPPAELTIRESTAPAPQQRGPAPHDTAHRTAP
ncbi:LacI family DNA-binding transcriptional regulator [Streptomyces millisiae]|uniref:LacI family DNA-binding transcriptional regulator n=1 Tax=Streptomyces millisiae TaxID=3075542 RepID=A0ABU2M0I5_9ACTN|nr:LacI family DNA-binding transcriptional regulator [Streptomyces sp. DSM 44918]MDT0323073.1 LacI family DNA-binding transcriptional regulator [Streptomyces sp. DSM 44918]